MKKSILFVLAIGSVAGASAQQAVRTVPVSAPDVKQRMLDIVPGETFFSQEVMDPQARATPSAPSPSTTTEDQVGTTNYPLQTNRSTMPRVVYNSDGTISCAWTYSNGAWNTWSDRGTGYNYFNGTSWQAFPTARLENGRTGFTNIVVTGSGAEITNAHNTAAIAQHFMLCPAKGTNAWTDNTALIGQPSGWTFGTWWPRMCVGGASGDVIHHIALSAPTGLASGGGPYTNGQDGAILYSRSNDGGASFAVQNQVLAPFDETQELGYGGDDYAIDASGDVVAIVAGSAGNDVVLAKSTDGGQTWVKTIVSDIPIALYDWTNMVSDVDGDGIGDTLETNDGAMAVIIDNNNMVHVAFGRMRIINSTGIADSAFYFPYTQELMYWHEGMGAPVVVAAPLDLDQNGQLDLPNNPGGLSMGTYGTSLASHPSFAVDPQNNIYLGYDAIVENTDDGLSKAFRNIYIIGSADGGTTWSTPFNISDDPTHEKVYPSLARRATSLIVVEYQDDALAGHGVYAGSGTPPDPDNSSSPATIWVARVGAEDIIGVNEYIANISSVVVYPNPTESSANLAISSTKVQQVNVSIYNNFGQLVATSEHNLVMGGNIIELGTENYAAGIYVVNVTQGNSVISKKLIIR
jgi:hypothetical protein